MAYNPRVAQDPTTVRDEGSGLQAPNALTPGTKVRLSGLKGKPELNGQEGVVQEPDPSVTPGKYTVLVNGSTLGIKGENLQKVDGGGSGQPQDGSAAAAETSPEEVPIHWPFLMALNKRAANEPCGRLQVLAAYGINELEIAREKSEYADAVASLNKERDQVAKLKAQIDKMQAQISLLESELGRVRHATSSGPVWEYEDHKDVWLPYSQEASAQLMAALEQGQGQVRISKGSTQYVVDLEAFQQRRERNGTVRRIRCKLGAPSYWQKQDGDFVRMIRGSKSSLRKMSESFEAVTVPVLDPETLARFTALVNEGVFHDVPLPEGHGLCKGMPKQGEPGARWEVVRALRVENLPLYHEYEQVRSKIQQHLKGVTVPSVEPDVTELLKQVHQMIGGSAVSSLNERVLLHGTRIAEAQKIVCQGFKLQTSREGGQYGQDIYFTRQTCKASQYCIDTKLVPGAEKVMILSLVTLGDYYVTDSVCKGMKVPPPKSKLDSRNADSVIAKSGPMEGHQHKVQTHDEYIIFDSKQAYPAFILFVKEI